MTNDTSTVEENNDDNNVTEELIYSLALGLVDTGLNEEDIFNLATAIENNEIHTSDTDDVSETFKNTIVENRKVAFRRTFGKNAVIFGPTGIAVIERNEVMFCFPYEKGRDGCGSFEIATRIHGDFLIYKNDTMNISLD